MKVVDSPPGTTRPSSPSSCSGFRTSTASAPRRRSIAACSRKFPCTARTPILTGLILVFALQELGGGNLLAPAPRQVQRDPDEQEPDHGERHRSGPGTAAAVGA